MPKTDTIREVEHHYVQIDTIRLHYVSAGATGSPVLLVHGFPETWWSFHKLIPLLALSHRVFAVDLRGFGDSDTGAVIPDSKTVSEDLHQFISALGVGPVHITAQDIAGASVFRLASTHPEDVRSFTAIEMGLPGFGLEVLADITHGGAWYIGLLAAPGVPEMLLTGREQEFLKAIAYPAMCARPDAVSGADVDEFVRTYAWVNGWRAAAGLYQSMLKEGPEIKDLAAAQPLKMPVLAVGARSGAFTADTMRSAVGRAVRSVQLEGVGHYAAMEAPEELSEALLTFWSDAERTTASE